LLKTQPFKITFVKLTIFTNNTMKNLSKEVKTSTDLRPTHKSSVFNITTYYVFFKTSIKRLAAFIIAQFQNIHNTSYVRALRLALRVNSPTKKKSLKGILSFFSFSSRPHTTTLNVSSSSILSFGKRFYFRLAEAKLSLNLTNSFSY
jgi:hypothetical protein